MSYLFETWDWLDNPRERLFFERLLDLGAQGAWQPSHMLSLFCGEADLYTWAGGPQTAFPKGRKYQGLPQMGPNELRDSGYDVVAMGPFWKTSAAVQLEHSARYFAAKRRLWSLPEWESPGHLWCANLAPAHVRRNDRVVYARSEHPKEYEANRRLDVSKDGVITRDDLDIVIEADVERNRRRFNKAIAWLNVVRADRLAAETPKAAPLPVERGLLTSVPILPRDFTPEE